MTKNRIQDLAEKHFMAVRRHREHLHRNPELSFEEYKTSSYISGVLDEIGIAYKGGIGGGTGIVAEIGSGSKTIALRADIDALPIQEEGEHDYKSQNEGIMHACGHDVHTSCLIGAAMILKEMEADLSSRVRLIFQPGEERLPGGASMMIKDGVLDEVDMIIGQHVHPDLEVGKMGFGPGYFMASADELYITIEGRGGHAAMPHKTIDPILISAEIIQALQSIVSRRSHPNVPSVLTIGKINSVGGATNVIPDQVKLEGTFRTYDEEWRARAHKLIEQTCDQIAQAHGARADVNVLVGYPTLYNDPEVTQKIKDGLHQFVGSANTIQISPRMTAEDFAYYSHEVPACFYRLGTSSPDGSNKSPVHTPTFDIDPLALKIGSGFMAYMAVELGK